MPIETPSNQPAEWLSLPVIATIARLLCRELTLQNEYLRLENKILKSRLPGRIRFTDNERRSLVDAALAMGRKLMETVVNIVTTYQIFVSGSARPTIDKSCVYKELQKIVPLVDRQLRHSLRGFGSITPFAYLLDQTPYSHGGRMFETPPPAKHS